MIKEWYEKIKKSKTFKWIILLLLGFSGFIVFRLLHSLGNFLVDTLNLQPMTMFWIGLGIPLSSATLYGFWITLKYGHVLMEDDEEVIDIKLNGTKESVTVELNKNGTK